MSTHDKKASSTMDLKKKLMPEEDQQNENTELLEHPSYIELQEKLTKAEDKALRIQAEMENSLRRAERDVANAHKYALEKFVQELLPIIDNLERTIAAENEKHTPENILEGVRLTLKLFYSAMQKFGVEQVNPLNQPFNPEFHEAISAQPDDSVAPGTVLNVLQNGYLLHNRLVRPALVVVSKS